MSSAAEAGAVAWLPFNSENSSVRSYENRPAEPFASVDQMDAILNRVESETNPQLPNMVAVEVCGLEISLGLGADRSFVQIQPVEGGDGPCWITVGDEADSETTVFYGLASHHSELSNRWLVSKQDARQAVREFVTNGKLLNRLRWLNLRA